MMPDHSPQPVDRKRRWIAPLILAGVAVAVVGAAELVAISRRPAAPAPIAAPPAPAPKPVEPSRPPPPLARTDLVEAAEGAADDYARGAAPPSGKDPLVGRSFRLLIPFGCAGPQSDPGVLQAFYDYDPVRKTVKVTVRPAVWTSLPLVQNLRNADKIEAVEGFWVPRPWTTSEACPAPRDGPVPATPTPPAAQTLGLARLFEKDGSRVLRRDGRPYEFVRKVAEGDTGLVAHPYRLVLEGRVTGYADGRSLHCWSESVDHRPICLYAVEFDRVALEDAVTNEMLAEWKE